MHRSTAGLLLIPLLAGCVAETVERRKPRRGPVAEVGFVDLGGGHVRYSTEGWGPAVALRRSSAMRKMRGTCKPLEVKILAEETREDADTPYSQDDLSQMAKGVEHFKLAPYHHITYECLPKDQPYLKPGDAKK